MPSIKSLMIVFEVQPTSKSHAKEIFNGLSHNEDIEVHA